MELSKKEKQKMKQFELSSRESFVIYLQELITRTYKCIRKHKRYLDKLESYINIKSDDKTTKDVRVPEEDYSEFLSLLSDVESYLLNLIGDHQQSSMSYKKFREVLDRKNKKGHIDFEVRKLDEDIAEYLSQLNKLRNWQNHVPESLLTSQIRFIEEGKMEGYFENPIVININNYYTLEYLIDLYNGSKNFHNVIVKVHQNMKKDYSCLIGESVRIEKNYIETSVKICVTEATKMSAEIQGLNITK
ncbi:hypothetical protein [Clostridium sp.]|uniref:hypothetical protein n=1 Tax=Clostridium sp. TaxID=1506 RepID=UPI00290A7D10|nr:hypothetical protein [Clostridium sp.]MDU7365401.1 hypothetical protein [Clostridium sp.]